MEYRSVQQTGFTRQINALRVQSGLNHVAIAEALKCSQAKVSRMFSGARMPTWSDTNLLLHILGADATTTYQLLALWNQIKDAPASPFTGFADILTPGEQEFAEMLQYVDRACINGLHQFPLILRSPAYQDQVMHSYAQAEAIGRWREVLPLLQVVLNPPRSVNVMLDEGLLMRVALSGPQEQWDHLLGAHEAGIHIRIMPLSVGAYAGMVQGFSGLFFDHTPDADRWCVTWAHKPIDWVDPKLAPVLSRVWEQMSQMATAAYDLPAIVELARRYDKRRPSILSA